MSALYGNCSMEVCSIIGTANNSDQEVDYCYEYGSSLFIDKQEADLLMFELKRNVNKLIAPFEDKTGIEKVNLTLQYCTLFEDGSFEVNDVDTYTIDIYEEDIA